MKIDRLLGIVIYLLNRELVSARVLAERFEVSLRTIQRDIDALMLAGIPVRSVQGSTGGYGIMSSYRLDKQVMDTDDFFFIITALKSLSSAYENGKIKQTLEKIMSLSPTTDEVNPKSDNAPLQINLSVLRESPMIDLHISQIEQAIGERTVLAFDYTSANHQQTHRTVEPLIVVFRWYAWYLFAYCQIRKDYRLFRLSRIRNLTKTALGFTREHLGVDDIIQAHQDNGNRSTMQIKLLCNPAIRVSVEDYFANGEITDCEDGSFILKACLPEDEPFWLGMILSYGAQVQVLEPPQLRELVIKKVTEIGRLYE